MLFVCILLLLLFKSTHDDLQKVHLFYAAKSIAIIKPATIEATYGSKPSKFGSTLVSLGIVLVT